MNVKMNVKLILSLSLWYSNEKGETLRVQGETGDRNKARINLFASRRMEVDRKM